MKSAVNKISDLIIFLSAFTAVKRDYDFLRRLIKIGDDYKISKDEIYESLLQTYLFAGFPSALNSLKILNLNKPASTDKNPEYEQLRRKGIANCKKVYGKKTENLISKVKEFSDELSEWLIIEGYGKVYSRDTISFSQRELSAVASLIPLRFDDQLTSHFYGLLNSKFPTEYIMEFLHALRFIGYKSDSDYAISVFDKVLEKKNN